MKIIIKFLIIQYFNKIMKVKLKLNIKNYKNLNFLYKK